MSSRGSPSPGRRSDLSAGAFPPGPRRPVQDLEDLVVDDAVARNDHAVTDTEASARCIGDAASGLGNDERAGGDIPWLELQLPISVQPTGRHRAEIERGRPASADLLGPHDERIEV